MNSILEEGLMSVPEACEFLSLSRTSVWKLMSSGALAYTSVGRARRIPRLAVKALAAKYLNHAY